MDKAKWELFLIKTGTKEQKMELDKVKELKAETEKIIVEAVANLIREANSSEISVTTEIYDSIDPYTKKEQCRVGCSIEIKI